MTKISKVIIPDLFLTIVSNVLSGAAAAEEFGLSHCMNNSHTSISAKAFIILLQSFTVRLTNTAFIYTEVECRSTLINHICLSSLVLRIKLRYVDLNWSTEIVILCPLFYVFEWPPAVGKVVFVFISFSIMWVGQWCSICLTFWPMTKGGLTWHLMNHKSHAMKPGQQWARIKQRWWTFVMDKKTFYISVFLEEKRKKGFFKAAVSSKSDCCFVKLIHWNGWRKEEIKLKLCQAKLAF